MRKILWLLPAIVFWVADDSHAALPVDSSWPRGASPREIGERVAERFVALPHFNFGATNQPAQITYPEACTWYGALTFGQLADDTNLTDRLIERFELFFGEERRLIPEPKNVDSSVFGIVPLQIYIQTKDKKYLALGKFSADEEWEKPKKTMQDDLSPQTRFWIDDMYMITILQVQAFRATDDTNYLNRAAVEMTAYLDSLQQTNGLFYHAPDVPFFWGRGNGWMAAGMSELLRSLPRNHPQRTRILAGYKKMMASLLKYQDADGLWRQLIDYPESWPETSSSGMFTFAFITGVKNGWLDKNTYGPAARKGWLGLIKYLNENGDIREVCEGTNKRNNLDYYLNRKHLTGDLHGQAPILWCASAWLR
jgi:unsaturated rhamnogalacturonyl hydrolase